MIKSSKTPLKLKSKTPLKLRSKTPLKLSTPHATNDRYIPTRTATDMEMSYHLLFDSENKACDKIKKQLIVENCHGIPENAKILHLRTKPIEPDQAFVDNMKILYHGSTVNSVKKNTTRFISSAPEKILDAPDFKDDYYLNLIDWSSTNHLAVALNNDLYIWNATSGEISQLFSSYNTNDYITSTSWIQKGNILGIGNSKNIVELWDVNKQTCLRQMKSHTSRVGSLSWNQHILTSGSRSGEIHHHDVRVAKHHVGTLKLHVQEVCGLKWNSDGRHIASGANDNLVAIWDSVMSHDNKPLHVLRDHTAAVKAVSWCPWQSNLLATGGGTADRHIKIWNMYNGSVLQDHDAKSQISCILWSKQYKEIISSHGFQNHQLSIWKYPEMTKVCDLIGHSNRVLGMTMSPDEEMVASVAADETLRFWKCFAVDEKFKKSKESAIEKRSTSHTGLSRCIR